MRPSRRRRHPPSEMLRRLGSRIDAVASSFEAAWWPPGAATARPRRAWPSSSRTTARSARPSPPLKWSPSHRSDGRVYSPPRSRSEQLSQRAVPAHIDAPPPPWGRRTTYVAAFAIRAEHLPELRPLLRIKCLSIQGGRDARLRDFEATGQPHSQRARPRHLRETRPCPAPPRAGTRLLRPGSPAAASWARRAPSCASPRLHRRAHLCAACSGSHEQPPLQAAGLPWRAPRPGDGQPTSPSARRASPGRRRRALAAHLRVFSIRRRSRPRGGKVRLGVDEQIETWSDPALPPSRVLQPHRLSRSR